MMMIHNPATIAWGFAEDFRKIAAELDQIREAMIPTYEGKTGHDREKIIELLDAETWMTAEEAVEYGFADELEEEKAVAASLDSGFLVLNGERMDLSRYRNAPKLLMCEQPKPQPPRDDEQANLHTLRLAQVQVNKNRVVGGKD
jgi:ATP-dependent Clp protease protease subunit